MEQETPSPRMREGALIAAAIVAGSLILSWGMSGSDQRYQVAASGNTVVRLDTDSGEMIACASAGCTRLEPPDRAKSLGIIGVKVEASGDEPRKIEKKASNAP